jgi:hypothetical protein
MVSPEPDITAAFPPIVDAEARHLRFMRALTDRSMNNRASPWRKRTTNTGRVADARRWRVTDGYSIEQERLSVNK